MNKKMAGLSIAAGASLWGIIGLFVSNLYAIGFTPLQVVAVRAIAASIFLITYALLKSPHAFKIKISDSKYFIGTGIISIVLFNWCMFVAIEETSISVAAILLYTAPAFVTIFARFLFKEKLTIRKMLALAVTIVGCAFVVGVFPNFTGTISLFGLIVGIGSGFFYALYSIFGKYALEKYDSLTVTVYTFIFAAVAVTPFSGIWSSLNLFADIKSWMYIIGLGFLSTMLAFILYTKGLQYIESSRASIIATIEPVVAAIIGYFIFQETLQMWQYVGVIMVIVAVIIVQEKSERLPKKSLLETETTL
ncbi:DMT family transporter [Fredinandcohnia sp. QZ13]|uniref:DMT family transporter n=1 Tax=Fredinandcohnia sp. QZ13 TaxID=3073144 RepID=UPI0028532F57|nr:DMT family transporter [Fredinandcohnia sp. QZ13]MDR4889882.1 DMT family transporter [Fredinandcohnia sp. QZ13]